MRGKQGFRQTRNRDLRVVFAAVDANTLTIDINTATPASLNDDDPAVIFSGFQSTTLPQNNVTATSPVVRLAQANDKFVLLPYVFNDPGNTSTASQILVSPDATRWRTKTLPTRTTTDPLKHAWAAIHGNNGRFIASHGQYPDIAVSDDGRNWTLLQDVFAVNGFQQNGIVSAGGNTLLAAVDDAKTIYRSDDNGLTWAQIATNITITESTAPVQTKILDRVIALTYGRDDSTNVFFMLAKRDDISRYRYVLTSVDGVSWTQRLRVDLGTTGTPQEPVMASSPTRTVLVLNNLITATTIVTNPSASSWLQLISTPAANWRAAAYDGEKFIVTGEPRGTSADPVVMTLDPTTLRWSVKLTSTKKIRAVAFGPTVQPQKDSAVTLLLNMAGAPGSSTFVDTSTSPKTIISTNVVLSDAQSKWPDRLSAVFSGAGSNQYLSVAADPALAVGTNDFTIEAWVWLNNYSAGAPLWESNPIGTSGQRFNGFVWYFTGDGMLRVFRSGGDIVITAVNSIPLQTWTHVALVRQSDTTKIYVNGQLKAATNTTFNDTAAAGGASIGRFCDSAGYSINGYIGEFRFLNGLALYNGNSFTVPTAPFLNYTSLGAVNSFTVTSGNREAVLEWRQPWTPNSVTITSYVVQLSSDNGATWFDSGVNIPATSLSVTIPSLTNNSTYKFRIAAVTEDGLGPYATTAENITIGGDQYFNNVALLLHMDGAVGSNIFTNSAATTTAASAYGTTQISNTQNKFGGTAGYFNGSLNFLELTGFSSGYLNADFTIEGWVWLNNQANQTFFNTTPHTSLGISLDRNGTGNTFVYIGNGTNWLATLASASKLSYNKWHHVAVVRSGTTITLYHNGLNQGSVVASPTNSGTAARIGAITANMSEFVNGYIDEYRVTSGVARYSGVVFDVPGRFQDDGPLGAPNNFKAYAENQRVRLTWDAPRARGFSTIIDYNVQYSADNGATWNTFDDGASTVTTTTVTGLINNNNYLLRVAAVTADGVGPYATTATPVAPTNGDPFFNSVSLLLRFNETTGTFIDTSPRPKTLTANNGGATFNALSKWGDGSAFFQGGSLTTPSSTDFSFGTGDFTIEFWAYPTANTWAGAMINVGYYYDGILFRQRQGADPLYLNGNYVNWNSQTNMPLNVWTHMALVRESGVVAVYANGTRILTWNNTANLNPSGTFVTIGVGSHSAFNEPFYGYLDELRITKGVARYSGATVDIPIGPVLGAPE